MIEWQRQCYSSSNLFDMQDKFYANWIKLSYNLVKIFYSKFYRKIFESKNKCKMKNENETRQNETKRTKNRSINRIQKLTLKYIYLIYGLRFTVCLCMEWPSKNIFDSIVVDLNLFSLFAVRFFFSNFDLCWAVSKRTSGKNRLTKCVTFTMAFQPSKN